MGHYLSTTVRLGRAWTVTLVALALLGLASCGSASLSEGGPGELKGTSAPSGATALAQGSRYIVVFKPGATAADATTLSASLSHHPEQSYHAVFTGFAGQLSATEVAALKANPKIAYIEPDLLVQIVGKPSPPPPPPQMYSWGYLRIWANWNAGNGGKGGAGVTVAVIDTGIDLDHPDLAGAIVANYNVLSPRRPAEDDNGHGTHVAGIIAARNNTIGVVGVAPQCSLVAVKALDLNGSGSIASVIAGIDWIAAHASQYNIRIANMSLGGLGYSQSYYDAIKTATNLGVTFVAAAGNESSDAANYQPASFDNVICVSALTSPDTFASYSNWGSVVDIIAPGTQIYSLWLNGGYLITSGTSMAAPHVAGSAALWLDNHTGGFAEVYAALTSTGEAAPPGGWPGDPDGISEPLVNAAAL